MQSKSRKVYVNSKQAEILNAEQKRRTFQAGRGTGKSTVIGFLIWAAYNYLPRAKFFLAALTYNHALTKTLPAVLEALNSCGLKEYDSKTGLGHYVVCRRPPDNWLKPYQTPRKYEYCLTFINGFTIEILSLDSPDGLRGGNYDGGFIDESALIKRDVVFKVLRPMIRGNIYRFSHFLHQIFADFSSAAWLPSGQWIYETKELAEQFPEKYKYVESTALDNLYVLGQNYIDDLRNEMTSLEFDVEVMNKRIKKLPNCYYPAFDEKKHCVWKTFHYNYNDESGLWLGSDNDLDPKLPIDTSWDFNGHIVSCLVAQASGRQLNISNYIYAKHSTLSLIDEACNKFTEQYSTHQRKEVFIYGDPSGLNKRENDPKTFYESIIDNLKSKGWNATIMVKAAYPQHKTRHIVINQIFSETMANMPVVRINQNKCKFLIISIENSPILPDFKKNKESERMNIEQERATHASDCMDYLIMGKFKSLFGINDYDIGPVFFA